MHKLLFPPSDPDPFPLLDEEFDKAEDKIPSSTERAPVGLMPADIELAWDDQLDNGEEMSL